jgi:hypothetical protein
MFRTLFQRRHQPKVFAVLIAVFVLLSVLFYLSYRNEAYANLLPNPGCDTSTSSWSGWNATLSRSTAVSRSGGASCLVTRTTGTYYTIDDVGYSVTNPTQGQIYSGSVWVRSDSAVGKTVQVIIRFDEGQPSQRVFTTTATLTNTWQQLNVTATVDTTTRTSVDFYVVQQDAVAGNTFYVDDMSFALNNPVAPSPTPTGPVSIPSDWCNDTSGVTCTSAWGSRKKITINNSASGSNLNNFPVLVKLDATRVDYGKTQNAGQDIRFVDPADKTTVLNHEIESWNEGGTSYIWVKVPQLDAGSTTDYIWLYYNNSAVAAPATQLGNGSHATGVWDSGYLGVWHLNQNGDNSGADYLDSTANAKHGVGGGGTANNQPALAAAGISGGAQVFTPEADYIDIPSLTYANNITASVWYRGGTQTASNWNYLISADTEAIEFGTYGDSLQFKDTARSRNAVGPGNTTNNAWHNATGVINGTTMALFVDGNQSATISYPGGINNGAKGFVIGGNGSNRGWNGTIDEVRISSIARSADWIEAEYRTMTDTMLSYENEKTLGSPTLLKAINFNGAQLDVDGVRFQAEATAGVSFPTAVTRFANTTTTLNPAVSANKTSMIRDSIWRGSSLQLNVDVDVPNATYLVYLYSWEDNSATTFNIGFEDEIVASAINSGGAGSWKRLGPYEVTVTDGKLSLYQTGGDFNLSGMEIYEPASTTNPIAYNTITFRAASNGNNGAGSSTLVLNKPAGTVANDVMIAHVSAAGAAATTITLPTGWNVIRRDNSTSSVASVAYFKVAGASEPATYTWTISPSNSASGGIASYYNVDTSSPIDAHSGLFTDDSPVMTAPSVVTTTPADMLLFIGSVQVGTTVTPPSGMTGRWTAGGQRTSHLSERLSNAKGATGNLVGQHAAGAQSNISMLVALRPSIQSTSGPPPVSVPGSIANLNFFITNYNPWFQTVCGDFRLDDGLDNPVPSGQSMMVTNASCSTPGIVYSGDLPASFGQGQASSTNQVVGGHTYPEVYSLTGSDSIFSSYEYLSAKAQNADDAPYNLAAYCTVSNCTLPASLPEGIYTYTGDVVLNGYTFPAGQDYVILVNGNLTIRGNIVTPVNGSVVISASGNIIIPPTVGGAPAATTANLSGIFSTDESFIIQSTNTCADLRLNIAGVLVVNAARSGGSLQNERDMCGNNLANPVFQITQRLDLVLNLPEFMRIQSITSNEVAP